ncbi:FAD-binding oxidoreductase [Pseudohoeflea suaedae]|uniref:FAD-binding oxidoreductase n=1 Tax=Pseudohoeflea suaedae TaxID=877384 RepID=A0A4R5PP21_9HYPH|nr:FAD-binding oxidoreductase [Pseudohoeflea suaedae]TDH38391.1 FAD-binding oxidoreductase [Pseudohoeflea suaedae]
MDAAFTQDAKLTPFWWEAAPPYDTPLENLPRKVDALIIGSGYTGLHAAIELARGGRSVLVCDRDVIGNGCSTRNGGQISTAVKPTFSALAKAHGVETAKAIFRDGRRSLAWTGEFIRAEGIDCDFKVCGRFHVAHNDKAFRALASSIAHQPQGFEVPAHVVPRAEQRRELGTGIYHGGVIFENHASLDPGRYHAGLVKIALEAGVLLAPRCEITGLSKSGKGHRATTARGEIEASDVVLATNGYSGKLSPWHQRRVMPIGSYVIATEELPEHVVDEIIPKDRIVSDSRHVLYYFRASPDRKRIIFGGRVSISETDPRTSGKILHRELVRLFPQLEGYRVSHSWMGFVGYTFDTLAHVGNRDGIHYSLGYCGSGVGMAGFQGRKIGQRILGLAEGETGYTRTPFPGRLYYSGKPWFLGPAIHVYRIRDRLGI